MAELQIRFDDGAAYERMMGIWSRLAGEIFLDWLAPHAGLRWLDVGCGNGAFTALVVERCAPAEVQGIDPSAAQLAFARARGAARVAEFRQGDAMALPFSADRFDAAVMARPGGIVATYVWDVFGGGFPPEPIHAEMRALGLAPLRPPRSDVSRMEALWDLWTGANLDAVETREIAVQRTFADFDDFWTTSMLGASIGPTVAAMASGDVERLKTRVGARLPADAAGRITYGARANAIKGRVPS